MIGRLISDIAQSSDLSELLVMNDSALGFSINPSPDNNLSPTTENLLNFLRFATDEKREFTLNQSFLFQLEDRLLIKVMRLMRALRRYKELTHGSDQ